MLALSMGLLHSKPLLNASCIMLICAVAVLHQGSWEYDVVFQRSSMKQNYPNVNTAPRRPGPRPPLAVSLMELEAQSLSKAHEVRV